ncbi:MAG: ribonuclease J [Lachnospiraceae bacterium]|nr:ribonuclease J [Lachnospiraceae bacterium]
MEEEEKTIRIIPLGGFNKLGMNMTVMEYQNDIIVIDCGASFPQNNSFGIDTTIPDITYLKENREKIRGVILTHAHEDHIGAVPYVLPEIDVPVYGTPLTVALVKKKVASLGIGEGIRTKVIRQGNTIKLGEFRVEFIKSNHSIPDSVMLAIYSPAGIIIHTGDFKVDYAPVIGGSIDLQRLGMLGYKGVLAVMSDSTNSMRKGSSESEAMVADRIDALFAQHRHERLIISTFASNMDRVQQIIEIAERHKRKVILHGDDMKNIFSEAMKLGYITIPENTLIEEPTKEECDADDVVFIIAGQHGESLTELTKIAEGSHELIRVRPKDTLIFSSIQVRGYEDTFSRTISSLETQGVHIEYRQAHATGHACEEELKLIYSLIRPEYVIPAHGEFRQRRAAGELAETVGVEKEKILMLDDGDVLELSEKSAKVVKKAPAGEMIVDGSGVGAIGQRELEERSRILDNGVIVIELCFGTRSGSLLARPAIVSKGFLDKRKQKSVMDGIYSIVLGEVSRAVEQSLPETELKKEIKESVGRFLFEQMRKKPVIITMITKIPE